MADDTTKPADQTSPANPTIPAPQTYSGTGFPAARVSAVKPQVGGYSGYWAGVEQSMILGQPYDDNERWFGDPRLYRRMRRCPPIDAAIRTLKSAVLAHGIQVNPRIEAKPHAEPGDDPEAELSAKVAEEFRTTLANLKVSAEDRAYEMMDAMWQRSKLGDIVWGIEDDEDGTPKMRLKSVDPKARDTWDYVVDPFLKVQGILCGNGASPALEIVDPSKFAIMVWDPCDGDPRGNTILEPLYPIVEVWRHAWPQWLRYIRRSAGERLLGKLGEGAIGGPPLDANGIPTTGADVSPEEYMTQKLAAFDDQTCMVIGAKDDVVVLEPKNKGEAFPDALQFARREMVSTILLVARATMEAEHGSKADSEGANDILGNLIRSLRRWNGQMWCRIAYLQTMYNYGPEIAKDHCPFVTLGEVDQQDVNAFLTALASVGFKLAPSQLPEIDTMAGLPVREVGEEPIGTPAPGAPNDPNTQGDPDGDGKGEEEPPAEDDEEKPKPKDNGKGKKPPPKKDDQKPPKKKGK
jgi:hypothetical protein